MTAIIHTERGRVRVVEAACKNRPCLHIHWSRFPTSTKEIRDGSRVETYPLVCIHNEEHGCPHPKPDPVKSTRAA